MELRLEFTIEPFLDGRPGPHVRAALDEAVRMGLEPEMGPFGTTVEGDASTVLAGLGPIVGAAVGAGATRLSLSVSRGQGAPDHPFLQAMAPLAEALDARVVPVGDLAPGDIPLAFEGEILGGLRLPLVRGLLEDGSGGYKNKAVKNCIPAVLRVLMRRPARDGQAKPSGKRGERRRKNESVIETVSQEEEQKGAHQ